MKTSKPTDILTMDNFIPLSGGYVNWMWRLAALFKINA